MTIRDRDEMTQERVSLDQVQGYLAGKLLAEDLPGPEAPESRRTSLVCFMLRTGLDSLSCSELSHSKDPR